MSDKANPAKSPNYFSEAIGGSATDFGLPQLSQRGKPSGPGANLPLNMAGTQMS